MLTGVCFNCHGISCLFSIISTVSDVRRLLWNAVSYFCCGFLLIPRYAVGIVICSISLFTILFVLLGVTFGMIGFRKNIDPQDRTRLSHCGGICLLVYIIGLVVFYIIVRHCKGGICLMVYRV